MTTADPVATPPAWPGFRARLLWIWAGFWLLLFLPGLQDYFWSGGRRLWQPFIDYGSAALVATPLAALQMRRGRRLRSLLGRPAAWFVRMWAWLPVQLVAYTACVYALRAAVYAAIGERYVHGAWREVLPYETAKFVLFYLLLGGIQFGVSSYRAWLDARSRAEEQQRLAQAAQLAQLTQQVQPHFLFNALNTVSSLIHTDPDTADLLLTRLATLLRAATDAGQRPEQPLADELALLRAYADIMVRRFADRVAIDWQIDPAALGCPVPTLGLQPLLENCFAHVVERRRAPTRIAVRARRAGEVLQIEIEDDGDGTGADPPRRGVGLGNLERRLHSLHGDAATLALVPRPGGGLRVLVRLPCVR